MSTAIVIVVLAIQWLSVLAVIGAIGRPRKPIDAGAACVALIWTLILSASFVYLLNH